MILNYDFETHYSLSARGQLNQEARYTALLLLIDILKFQELSTRRFLMSVLWMCLEHDGTICVGIDGQLWVQFDVQKSILNTRINRASPHSDYPTVFFFVTCFLCAPWSNMYIGLLGISYPPNQYYTWSEHGPFSISNSSFQERNFIWKWTPRRLKGSIMR